MTLRDSIHQASHVNDVDCHARPDCPSHLPASSIVSVLIFTCEQEITEHSFATADHAYE